MNALAPSMTQSSPSRRARVRVAPASLPPSGSVRPNAPERPAGDEVGQPALLLLVVAEAEDRVGAEPDAGRQRDARATGRRGRSPRSRCTARRSRRRCRPTPRGRPARTARARPSASTASTGKRVLLVPPRGVRRDLPLGEVAHAPARNASCSSESSTVIDVHHRLLGSVVARRARTASGWSSATRCRPRTSTSPTTPSIGAGSVCSIFIASTTTSGWPVGHRRRPAHDVHGDDGAGHRAGRPCRRTASEPATPAGRRGRGSCEAPRRPVGADPRRATVAGDANASPVQLERAIVGPPPAHVDDVAGPVAGHALLHAITDRSQVDLDRSRARAIAVHVAHAGSPSRQPVAAAPRDHRSARGMRRASDATAAASTMLGGGPPRRAPAAIRSTSPVSSRPAPTSSSASSARRKPDVRRHAEDRGVAPARRRGGAEPSSRSAPQAITLASIGS